MILKNKQLNMEDYITFHVNLFKEKLKKLQKNTLSAEEIYEIAQLVKLVDDLKSEGYCVLFNELEKHKIYSHIKTLLLDRGVYPFPQPYVLEKKIEYSSSLIPLNEYLSSLILKAKSVNTICENSLIDKLKSFCEFVGNDEDTTYIFLLRDTLLPYLYFLNQGKTNIVPILLNRKFFNDVFKIKNFDDKLRMPIFNAVNFCSDTNEFYDFIENYNLKLLNDYPIVKDTIGEILSKIKTPKIVVVESGVYGTFPMLLKTLDERVEIKMFTTVPYLKKYYGDSIFTECYEINRDFETLFSQELLFELDSFKNGMFFVKETSSSDVLSVSLEEIKTILQFVSFK